MSLPNYDNWLEAPYQRMAEEEERRRCPECDVSALEDDGEGVTCSECGYSIGPPDPYDEARERELEDRYDDREVW